MPKNFETTRKIPERDKNFRAFLGTLADIPKGSIMDHHHYASPMISPTAHFALNTAVRGKVTLEIMNHFWPKMSNIDNETF